MGAKTVILLPPSEGKTPDGSGPPWSSGRSAVGALDRHRMAVLDALGDDHPARTGATMPALDRYSGVLYKELDAGTLRGTARRRLNRNVLTVSGLWGLAAPTDPIPYYKLKMSSSVPPLGKLSTWWRPHLTDALVSKTVGAVVWDLLPNEHAAAVEWGELQPRQRVTVQFLDRSGRTVSHWNKLLKGSIVRWLLQTGETDPLALECFTHPQGYRLDLDASTVESDRCALVMREQD
ncbi:MAG: peroxide stress protein YaaA [Aquihabitans sp.]